MGSDHSTIFFRKPGFELAEAEQALRKSTMTIVRNVDSLSVVWEDGPELTVRYRHGEEVRREAIRISGDSLLAGMMREFDSAFEIAFDDIDHVLDDINTLIETQSSLRDATEGVIACSWNEELQGPEEA